jgi:CBS domain-containing protein
VLQAVEAMTQNRTGACVVIDDGRLVGCFTERDVMSRVVSKKLDPAKVPIGEVCTKQLVTATPDMAEAVALRTMVERHIRHLPVVDGQGKFVGMLSLRRLLQERVDELSLQLEELHAYVTADALGG